MTKFNSSRITAPLVLFLAGFFVLPVLAGCGKDGGTNSNINSASYEAELLKTFHPVLIQKLADDYQTLPYPPTSDRIGKLSLHPDPEGFHYAVQVDTASPVMYSKIRKVTIHGNHYYQLVYALFYPERPIPLTSDDNPIEYLSRFIWSGPLDGKVIRITLDALDRFPLFVEVSQNCGCTWRLFVNKTVDDAARAEFEDAGQVYPGLVRPEAPHDVPYVWIMPEDLKGVETRVVVVAEDGWSVSSHDPMGVYTSYEQWSESGPRVDRGVLYLPRDINVHIFDPGPLNIEYFTRLDYDPLYSMAPEGLDWKVGIFDQYRRVWNSYPPFSLFLRSMGLTAKFPGTPIDVNFLEVVHETLDYWDTSLYDLFIHMPHALFNTHAEQSVRRNP